MSSALSRMMPQSPLARRLCLQSMLFAIGEGVFLTGSAVFFTQVVDLTAVQVGLGLTIAGVVTSILAVPLGRAADRIGPKRMWSIAATVESLLYLAYPAIDGVALYITAATALQLASAAGGAGRGAYTLDIFNRRERARYLAFMRSALNIGFAVGAVLGGLALALGSDVIRALPIATALLLACNAYLITRLPPASHDAKTRTDTREVKPSVLRNRGFVALNICSGVLSTNQVLIGVVIPLWLVQETDAPHALLGWLFGTNTVLTVILQVRAARGTETLDGALRAATHSSVLFATSCVITLFTDDTFGWVTVCLAWLGHIAVTGAELFQSAASWGFAAELSDPDRRGEYQGASRLGHTLGRVCTPAIYTFLATTWGDVGWLIIACTVLVATILAHPAARAAERYLRQNVSPPTRPNDV